MRRHPFILLLALGSLVVASACGPGRDAPAPRASVPAAATRAAGTPRIVFLGDSLTAGLGLAAAESYPALIQARLDREGYRYEVVNAGVSGDTSAGGLRRLDWSLDGNAQILVIALGANDGLRGLAPDELRKNLLDIIERGQTRGLAVILAGMEAPPNNGPEYTASFRATFTDLARERRLPLVPFLLQGVAGDAAFNQADGIHPNARGAQRLADAVWRILKPALTAPTEPAR